jgi:hypothetical protein
MLFFLSCKLSQTNKPRTSVSLTAVSCCSETNDVNTGLLIEVWSKGMLWDNALGYHWIPLPAVKYSSQVGSARPSARIAAFLRRREHGLVVSSCSSTTVTVK